MKNILPAAITGLMLVACSQPRGAIQTFEECMLAGYPIQESMPRRCAVPNGPTFTEELPPVVRALDDLHGVFLGMEPEESGGETRFRFRIDEGERIAVLDPDSEVIAMSTNFGPADLHNVASGTILNIQGWSDADGIVHAVKVRIRD